ncbi:MAG: cell wall-binding protein [Symbiobacteriaceae bacterium]|jgi:murein DD-endopeptidase MepM/ murein hydrolase activator NlpD|nr:cell wall-binding protein [Symbiobacteriaceae bacterium]
MVRSRKLRYRWLILPVVLASLLIPSPDGVRADDLADDIRMRQEKMDEAAANLAAAKSDLDRVYWQREQIRLKLQNTEYEMNLARAKHAVLDAQRQDVQATWSKLDASVKETEARLASRKGQFHSRLRAIQERGRVSYLGVLLGSASYGDFLSRMEMLQTIVKHDVELMTVIRADKQQLEGERTAAAAEEARLKGLAAQAQEQADLAAAKQAEFNQQDKALQEGQRALELAIAEWEVVYERLGEEIYKLQLEQKRKAGRFAPIEPIRGYPPITDDFGFGPDPIVGGNRNHGGTDFGANRGTPILAIEDGVVIARRYDSVYGNLLIIDHGGGIASWYGHAESYMVSEGETVKQGQQVGKVGSTGYSTGPHLHLEIRVENVRKDPMSYLPPR